MRTFALRIPVSVRMGRVRWAFRMPPVHLRMLPVRKEGAELRSDFQVSPGVPYRAALTMLRVVLVPLVALAHMLRTQVEVCIGPEEAP